MNGWPVPRVDPRPGLGGKVTPKLPKLRTKKDPVRVRASVVTGGPKRKTDGGERLGSQTSPSTQSPAAHLGEGIQESHTSRASRGLRVRHHPGRTHWTIVKGRRRQGQGREVGRGDPRVPRPPVLPARGPGRKANKEEKGHEREGSITWWGRRKQGHQ